MEQLLNELLHYSRISRKKITFKNVNMVELVSDIKDTLKPILEEKGIDLQIAHDMPSIECEKILINELFTNLIVNSTKYNDKEHKWIKVGCDTVDGKENVFYVSDNGIGIKEKHLDAVFKIFKRIHSRDKYGGGTGFGLTIAKKIVEQHQGEIWLESEYGKGTTFYFTLTSGAQSE
ncbi:MAG: ATP-binding protein [Rickettsiales bacterium]|nr:ATP-binding protein [Rickettsiales bacterium]